MMENTKTLLVTGASSEVGMALIKRVSGNYGRIWAHYRSSQEAVDGLVRDIGDKVLPVRADFSDVDSTGALIDTIISSGDLPDHIVHLSAIKAHSLQFHKQSWDSYQDEIDTSLRSIVMILKAFIPRMAKCGHGKIVFMLSSYLTGVSPKFQSPYITVKYALLGLMKNIAAEYAGKGITANAVSPYMMETKFLSDLPELIKEQSAKNSPLGRNLHVDEVIPSIEFLLSSGSDLVTGQNISVTGGDEK